MSDSDRDHDQSGEPGEFDHLYEMMDQLDNQISEYQSTLSKSDRSTQRPRPTVVEEHPAIPLDANDPRVSHVPRWKLRHLVLFLLTCCSCFYIGSGISPSDGWPADPDALWNARLWSGFTYSASLMTILFAHEMGHYLQARRYNVAASPPYFIPIPTIFGTMGAVIVQRSGYADRKKLYDIAISGPLAGLVFALPIAWVGIQQSRVVTLPENPEPGTVFGDPLVMQWMYELLHGPLAENETMILNPLLFAGWVGIFITALNLIPIGQLDGGHILYSLLRKNAHRVAMFLVYAALGYMVLTNNFQYALMLGLIVLMGPRHPPTANDQIELGTFRIVLGWLTLAFIFIGFTPVPIVM